MYQTRSSPLTIGAAALTLCLLSGTALAQNFTNINPQTYATEAILGAGGTITISDGSTGTGPSGIEFISAAFTPGATPGFLQVAFTLPPNVDWFGTPAATTLGNFCSVLLQSVTPHTATAGGTATFEVTTCTSGSNGPGTVTLNAFQITGSGVTAIGNTPTFLAAFQMTALATGSTNISTDLDYGPSTTSLAASIEQLSVTTNAPTTSGYTSIDIDLFNFPSVPPGQSGQMFEEPKVDFSPQVLADIGSIWLTTNSGKNAADSGPYQWEGGATVPTGTVTLTGTAFGTGPTATSAMTGINPIYLAPPPTATTCQASKPVPASSAPAGAVSIANPSGNMVTFPGVHFPTAGSTYKMEFCLYGSNGQVIGDVAKWQAAAQLDISPTIKDKAFKLLPYNYEGTVARILFSDVGGAYPAWIRAVNFSTHPVGLVAYVQTDGTTAAGGPGAIADCVVSQELAGLNNALISVQGLLGAGDCNVPAPGGRLAMLVFTDGFATSVEGLIQTPNGNWRFFPTKPSFIFDVPPGFGP